MSTIHCIVCGERVNAAAIACPRCGADPRTGEAHNTPASVPAQLANPASKARTPSRRFRIILYGVLVAILLPAVAGCGVATYFIWQYGLRSVPSDDEMIDNLRDHRQDFAELLRMLREDAKVKAVGFDRMDPSRRAAGISAERLKRYRELMRQAGIDEDMRRSHDPEHADVVWFEVVYAGGALTSDERGYVYASEPPGPLCDSLDGDIPIHRNVFRHVHGDWYLYRCIDP